MLRQDLQRTKKKLMEIEQELSRKEEVHAIGPNVDMPISLEAALRSRSVFGGPLLLGLSASRGPPQHIPTYSRPVDFFTSASKFDLIDAVYSKEAATAMSFAINTSSAAMRCNMPFKSSESANFLTLPSKRRPAR